MNDSFEGKIGTTIRESVPSWLPRDAVVGRPNVLLVVFDDTGWSDFGCFGSEIATPTVDRLARDGLRYNNFHVTPLCSPTRASLLTGRDNHSIGMRFLADADTGFPNSRGRIAADVPLMPDLLRAHGYATYLAGKWHLTPLGEATPAGPFTNWPLRMGFDRFYGFLEGCTDQYTPELIADNHQVFPPQRVGYHLSEDLADRSIEFIREHLTYRPADPFYLQLAFGATHAPFQAPREYIDKYLKVFDKGWDRTREDRLRKQIELGVVPEETTLCERNEGVQAWSELSSDERNVATTLQSAFAGFLEHADAQLGRVVAELEELGLLDNTIVLVMSDNGASREGGPFGDVDVNAPYSRLHRTAEEQLPFLDDVGTVRGPAHYPEGWAMAGNTPFRRYKQFVDLGGVRSPMVLFWPKGITRVGEIRAQFAHVIDIAPTLLDLAGVSLPSDINGKALTETMASANSPGPRTTQFWEMLGHRAIWSEGWKAVTAHQQGTPYSEDRWRLYRMIDDFSETTDVAKHHPEIVRRLEGLWWDEAARVGAFPLDDRGLVELLTARAPGSIVDRTTITLRPGQHLPVSAAVTGTDRALTITAAVEPSGDAGVLNGVIVSSGNAQGGYVFYLEDSVLHFEHTSLGQRIHVASVKPVPPVHQRLSVRILPHPDRSAEVELFADRVPLGSGTIPRVSAHLSFWGLDVGSDPVSQVSTRYTGTFPFDSRYLRWVSLNFEESPDVEDLAETMLATD